MTRISSGRGLLALAVAAGAAVAVSTTAPASAQSVASAPLQHIQLLSINDLHGNLEPPPSNGSGGRVQTGVDPAGKPVYTPAGGATYLSTHLAQLRQGQRDTFTLAAGDLIGASPLLSAAFHDEPTIEALNAMGVELSSVGNHEFDEGYKELLRIQKGGCIKDGAGANNQNSCADKDSGGKRFRGASFDYLAANVEYTSSGQPILAATHVEKFHGGAKVGFIGVVTKTTPSIVTASGIAGLTFQDEAETINKYAAKLQAQGVEAIVAVLHEGGSVKSPDYNDCVGLSTPITTINANVTPAVDVLVTGHSHQAYNCKLADPAGNPRILTQAGNYGKFITDLDLVLNRTTGDVDRSASSATNIINTRDVPTDPTIDAIIAKYTTYLGPIAGKQLGFVGQDLTRDDPNDTGETVLGDILADAAKADATVAAKGPIDIGFINPGGIRADLVNDDGVVTYAEAFSVQPFSNYVVSKTLTGAQVKNVLEQQFDNPLPGQTRILGVSGVTYSWSASAPAGSKISNILVNGAPIDLAASYRVAGNNFLLEGGDNFTTFAAGTDTLYGGIDIDAFAAYLTANSSASSPLAIPPLDRITALP